MAHEMAHVNNRDILIGSIAATIAGAITYLAHMAQWAAIFGSGDEDNNPLTLIGLAIVAPVAAMLVQKAQPMKRVNEATAHMFIVSPLKGNALASLFSTHPPMEERIRRLENMTVV